MFSSFKSLPHPYFRFLRWFLRVGELCLVVDPYAKERGEGRYGFVDFFISSSPGSYGSPVALIELKQVSLSGLCIANEDPSYAAMETLRNKLKDEKEEDRLLRRSFYYYNKTAEGWRQSSISDLKQAVFGQVIITISASSKMAQPKEERVVYSTSELVVKRERLFGGACCGNCWWYKSPGLGGWERRTD